MSESDQQNGNRARSLSEEQRTALIGELLGDVQLLHTSMKDLASIVRDSDQRISGRIVELRQVAADFAGSREAAKADLATQASKITQRHFTDSMGDLLKRIDGSLIALERLVQRQADRRVFELATAALMAGAITAVAALAGVWTMVH